MKGFEFRPKLFTAMKSYSKADLMTDLMAGIIVGIVALPLAIAFGIASGVSPEKELSRLLLPGLSSHFLAGVKCKSEVPQVHLSLLFMALSKNMVLMA